MLNNLNKSYYNKYPVLIDNNQLFILINNILDFLKFKSIVSKRETIKRIINARQLINFQNIANFLPENDDMAIFLKVNNAIDIFLLNNKLIDQSKLYTVLSYAAKCRDLQFSKNIKLIGFFKLSKILQKFFYLLSIKNNIFISLKKFNSSNVNVYKISFLTKKSEYENAILWAKKKIKKIRNIRICILDFYSEKEYYSVIQHDIKSYLNKKKSLSRNISFLDNYYIINSNIIKIFICLLNLSIEPVDYNLVSFLITSPYIKFCYLEHKERIKSDIYIKNHFEKFYYLDYLIQKLHFCPRLQKILLQFKKYCKKNIKKKKTAKYWKIFIFNVMKIFGFPNFNILKKQELYIFDKLMLIIEQYSQIYEFLGKHSFIDFIYSIKNLLNITKIMQEKDRYQGIYISKKLYSKKFDYVWICIEKFKIVIKKKNPFLPFYLQMKNQTNMFDFSKNMQYYRYFLKIILSNTNYALVISSIKKNNSIKRKNSFFFNKKLKEKIKEIKGLKQEQLYFSNTIIKNYKNKIYKKNNIYGGISSLYVYKKCLFKSYFISRFKIKKLEILNSNLFKYEKGIIVHAILKKIWNVIKTMFRLKSLNKKHLIQIVKKNARIVYHNYLYKRPFTLRKKSYSLEKLFIENIIFDWLCVEKKRKKGFYVKNLEKDVQYEILKHKINFRIDRIDNIYKSKEKFIIDYKYSKILSKKFLEIADKNSLQLILYYYSINYSYSSLHYAILEENINYFLNIKNYLKKRRENRKAKYWDDIFFNCNTIIINSIKNNIKFNFALYPTDMSECITCNLHSICKIYEKKIKT